MKSQFYKYNCITNFSATVLGKAFCSFTLHCPHYQFHNKMFFSQFGKKNLNLPALSTALSSNQDLWDKLGCQLRAEWNLQPDSKISWIALIV